MSSDLRGFFHRFGCRLLASAILFSVPALLAQAECGLDARNTANVPLPVIGAGTMSVALETEIRHGFYMVSLHYESAAGGQVLRHAASTAHAAGNQCAEALALFGAGQAERNITMETALDLFRRSAKLLATAGTPMALAHAQARIAEAEQILGDSDALQRESPAIAKAFHDAGDEAWAIMQSSLALQYAGTKPEEQKQLLDQLKAVDAPNLVGARGFVEWETGYALRRTGNFKEVLGFFHAALADLAQCECEPKTRGAILLNFASASDSTSDAAAVLDYARQAEALDRKYHLDTQLPQAIRLIAAGYAHESDWPHAIANDELALRLARERSVNTAVPVIGLELADTYGKSGQPLKALAILRDTAPKQPTPSQRCDLEAERLTLEDQAKLLPAAAADGDALFADCTKIIQPNVLALSHAQYAEVKMKQGQWDMALDHARESVRLTDLDRMRTEANDRTLRAFNENRVPGYNALVAALVHLNRPEEALLASEQYRARAFVDLASSSRPAPAARSAGTATGSRERVGLASEVHPFTLTVADIRASLEPEHATLVSYWLSKDGRLTTWVVAPGKPVFQAVRSLGPLDVATLVKATLPLDDGGTRRGAGVRVATRGGTSQVIALTSRKPWHDLYDLLIAPIAAQLPQERGSLLTIVPQGTLFQLSFPALLAPDNHYLIEQYAVNTVPSAGVLQITAKNGHAADDLPASYLLVANPTSYPQVDGHDLPPLPGTDSEVRNISHQLDGKTVTLLEGHRAGIDTLIESLPSATLLHFATHAVVSDNAPLTSFLALDRTQHGGVLTAEKIYGLHINANLVVLSACSTGRGLVSGDGVAGLSRAFFYAGAASLITTLWDVVDEPTAELMPRFYARLAQGSTRSAALREAQLELISDLRQHHVRVKTLAGTTTALPERPAYWAAFSLSGQP